MTSLALDARLPFPAAAALSHFPGDTGWPVIGNVFPVLADPKAYVAARAARFGLVFIDNTFGETCVSLLGPDGNEFVLLDPQHIFSSRLGWERFLGPVFPRGLMLMDFDEHRINRRALSVAFKSGPMRTYLAQLDGVVGARVRDWRAQPKLTVYPAMKQLTLDLAARTFLGADLGPETAHVIRDFADMVAAIVSPIRKPLPFTQLRRGIATRSRIVAYFSKQVPLRRERDGDDLFTQLCLATTEDGALLPPDAVVDHMSFFMMAAHDTLTSSLTAFVWKLAANPDWQTRLRGEVAALGLTPDEPLPFDRLDALPLTGMAFKEVLRQVPPVPAFARRALRDVYFKRYHIPPGTPVRIDTLFTHHMPEIWPDPERFDPLRFTDEAQAARHRFAYLPYGGGAHMCLGLNYAQMQAKVFARHFLSQLSVAVAPGYAPRWQMLPIPKPRDGLLVALAPA